MNSRTWLAALALGLWGVAAWGEEVASGDRVWSVDDPGTYYAGIENAAGHALMQLCDTTDGACFYAVTFNTRCRQDETYQALVNSDAGNGGFELYCGAEVNGRNLLFVQDFEQMEMRRAWARAAPAETKAKKARDVDVF